MYDYVTQGINDIVIFSGDPRILSAIVGKKSLLINFHIFNKTAVGINTIMIVESVITNRRLHFLIYDLFGELNADFDFGEVDENYNIHREIKGIRLGKEFGLVAVASVDIAFKETRHVVKCVDTTKYIG